MIKRFFYWVIGKHSHQWSKWKFVPVYVTYISGDRQVGTGYEKVQRRECKGCGLVEEKELTISGERRAVVRSN